MWAHKKKGLPTVGNQEKKESVSKCVCTQGEGLGVCGGSEEVVGWNAAGFPAPSGLSYIVSEQRVPCTNNHNHTHAHTYSALISYYMLFSSVISRAPGLKLVVETLMSSLKPIGNIVVICCAFFIIFGILGVQVRRKGEESVRKGRIQTEIMRKQKGNKAAV